MKFFLDENITFRVKTKIYPKIMDCIPVGRSGLSMPAKDISIWEFAKTNDYIIIKFDEDFEELSNLYGFPPKVILLRLGNSSPNFIANILLERFMDIESSFDENEYGVLEIFK